MAYSGLPCQFAANILQFDAMPSRPDDFPRGVQEVLLRRAGGECSLCTRTTVGPHTDPEKASGSGIAAHICAASPDGPRYDETQTRDERRSASNGIWVCHNCSDLIDKDPSQYPPAFLRDRKRAHEDRIRQEIETGGRQSIPVRRRPATLIGAALALVALVGVLTAGYLSLQPGRLRISPGKRTIKSRGDTQVFPLRITNASDADLEERAVLLEISPALPNPLDVQLIPERLDHLVTANGIAIDERSLSSHWQEAGKTEVLQIFDTLYSTETVAYSVVLKTAELPADVTFVAREVEPGAFASHRPSVTLQDSPHQAMTRMMRGAIGKLVSSPTGTIGLIIADGEWRTTHGEYSDLLPIINQDGFRIHLYRDVDDTIKLDLSTPQFPGGTLSQHLEELPALPKHVLMFGWLPGGIIMKIDLRPSVTLGSVP